MPIDKFSIENPPECITKINSERDSRLGSLLVVNLENAKRNHEIRNKLECKTDGVEFKLKATKEIAGHIKAYFH